MTHPVRGIGIMVLTIFLSLMFLLTPLPSSISAGRPLLPLLMVMYWALYCPDEVGVATAWMVGFFTDFMYGIILGPYAMGFAAAVYVVIRIQSRLQMFPMFQQTVFVGMLVAAIQLSVIVLGIGLGRMEMPWSVLWSIPTTALCWPIITVILDSARGLFSQVE